MKFLDYLKHKTVNVPDLLGILNLFYPFCKKNIFSEVKYKDGKLTNQMYNAMKS